MHICAHNSGRFDIDINADNAIIELYNNASGKIKVKSKNIAILMNDKTDLKGHIIANKTNVSLS